MKISFNTSTTFAIIFLVIGLFLFLDKPDPIDWSDLTASRSNISIEKPFTESFSVKFNERYYIGIDLTNHQLPLRDSIMKYVFNNVGEYDKTIDIDFKWTLYENDKEIAKGSGLKPITGLMGNVMSFYEFNANTSNNYKIVFMPSDNFKKLINANPELVISVAAASVSVGIAFGHSLRENYSKPISYIILLIGVVFSVITISIYKRNKNTT